MEERSYQILRDQSFDWIRKNPKATNLQVPDDLAGAWIFDQKSEEDPQGFFFAVFAFGFLQRELLRGPSSKRHPMKMPLDRLYALFPMWQLKLAVGEVARKTDIKADALPLWEFPAREKINFWSDTTAPS